MMSSVDAWTKDANQRTRPQTPLAGPLQALAALVQARPAAADSPVLLPLLQVEASPTTGIHGLPLFQGNSRDSEGGQHQQTMKRGDPDLRAVFGKQSVANSDGWQWRKYGEKLVKGSPNPRSYYKCSHPGCSAKKIVERCDRSGDILSTEYKGDHTHPAPNAAKASRFKPKAKIETAAPAQVSNLATSKAAAALSAFPGLLGVQALPLGLLPFGGMLPIPDALRPDFQGAHQSTYNNGDEDEDDDTDTSEPEPAPALKAAPQDAPAAMTAANTIRKMKGGQSSPSKRLDALAAYAEEAERALKSNSNSPEAGPSTKRPRLEAPTAKGQAPAEGESPEDDDGSTAVGSAVQRIMPAGQLDDGYKWRKYGQKQVKGSPYPRSYYKCTHAGCTVRKHVERSMDDENMFVVTYEGSHNHRPPTPFRRFHMPANGPDATAPAEEEEEADEGSSQPTSPHEAARGGKGANPALAQQLQQLQANLLASSVMQQAALSSMLPFLPYASTLNGESLASFGLASEALEALNPLNLATASNLTDLTGALLRRTAEIDMALAAHAQAMSMDAAAASWDPLACLITPRPNTNSPAIAHQATSKAARKVAPGEDA